MTNANHALLELADKGADVDMLRQMVQFMAQRLMEIDVERADVAPPTTRRIPSARTAAMATANASGIPVLAVWR